MPSSTVTKAGALVRLATWSIDRRRLVVGLWIALLVGVPVLAGVAGGEYDMEFRTPGAESDDAQQLLEDHFPARSGDTVDVVFRADAGVTDPSVQADVEALLGALGSLPGVAGVQSPYDPAFAYQLSPTDPTIAYASLLLDGTSDELPNSLAVSIVDAKDAADGGAVDFELSGFLIQESQQGEMGSEGIGLLVAAFILLLTFGSVLAMGLPIVVAVFGLLISSSLILLIANLVQVPDFAPLVAMMIGIGVGIDYTLFIVTRYRTELRQGIEPREAAIRSIATAGRAVLFAGCTVCISVFGLVAMGLEFLVGVALAAASGVLVVMLASVTLLPAVLGFVGRTIDRLRVPFVGRHLGEERHGMWWRWSRVVQRRPWPAALGAFVVLVALAAPVFNIRFGFPDAGNDAEDLTTRRAYDTLAEGFGPGFNGPFVVVVGDGESPVPDDAVASTAAALDGADGVDAVAPPVLSPDRTVALITLFPTTSPQSAATEQLVHDLRDDVIPAATVGAPVAITGGTAASIDINEYMAGRLPWFIGSVVVLSFLLLMTVFRSVLIALKASIMNVLSIAAAYGIVGVVISGGAVGELFAITEEVPLPAFMPMMMFAILFGLSMDYEVFLLSRVREEYVKTGDNGLAVADGLATTARVITAAAAIMVSVFLAFVLGDDVFVKVVGIGLASAILIDATIVRMVLVPATMELLGDRNWWLPRWLDRLLPNVHVEGEVEAILAETATDDEVSGDGDRELVGV